MNLAKWICDVLVNIKFQDVAQWSICHIREHKGLRFNFVILYSHSVNLCLPHLFFFELEVITVAIVFFL